MAEVRNPFWSRGPTSAAAAAPAASGFTSPTSLVDVILPLSWYSVGVELLASQQFQGGANAVWPVANQGVWIPFMLPCSFTVKQIWCDNGGTVAGSTDVGIYSASLARLVSTGPTLMAGVSVQQYFDIADTTLSAATPYFLAMSHSEGTATRLTFNPSSTIQMAAMGCFTQTNVGTLPDPAVPATPASAYFPMIGMYGNTGSF